MAAAIRCIEEGARAFLLDRSALPAAFFDLRTGVAGEPAQKLANYHIRMAGVIPDLSAHSPHFREFVREADAGRQLRFFATRQEGSHRLARIRLRGEAGERPFTLQRAPACATFVRLARASREGAPLLDSILLASPEERYEFFLASVARGGSVWALHCDEGWLFGEAASGELIFPVWPSARAALGSAELLSHAPAAIPSEQWIEVWLQCLAFERSRVGVFPTLTSPGTAVHPGILWAQLVERLP